MKKLSISLAILFVCAMFSAVAVIAQPASKSGKASATFTKTWIDYNIKQEGKDGMRIHTAFKVYGMKGVASYLQIRFQKADGTFLMDKNDSFNSEAGEVAVFGSLAPGYDPTEYEDFAVFMPYDELDLAAGKYALKMDIDVIYENGDLVNHLTYFEFDFNNPGKTTGVSAKFDRLWVDYGVTEGGKYGMRIHIKMTTYGMKNVDSYVAIYFQKKDGSKLYSNNETYRSKSGQTALFKSLKPAYDPADFNDLQVFMPYDEFNLKAGNYNLQMDADLIYENGDLIGHLTYYDFDFKTN